MRDRSILQSDFEKALAECEELRRHTIFVGGFPCQDLSIAGRQSGRKGSRSGLYRDYLTVIAAERPSWVITENVGHTWRKWVPYLRRSFHRLGYASLPLQMRASDVGAPHERKRIFIIAHADGELLRKLSRWWLGPGREMAYEFAGYGITKQMANAAGIRWGEEYSNSERCSEGSEPQRYHRSGPSLSSYVANADGERLEKSGSKETGTTNPASNASWWTVEPNVGRVAHGVPFRVDRLTAIGNAIVPQIAEIIACGIRECMKRGDL
jgi:DNA (cytosine-5)-methyltransferase 1